MVEAFSPKASMSCPNRSVMRGRVSPFTAAPRAPESIRNRSNLSANENNLKKGTDFVFVFWLVLLLVVFLC